MAYGWFVVPYKRRNPGQTPPERYPSMDDFTAQISADGGVWSETEILGDSALVKVRASAATLALISGTAGVFTIPTRFFRLEDSFADLTNGERSQISSAILSLGYTQAELDAAMGTTLALWRAKTLGDLLGLAATRRLRPRYDQATDTIVCDGPVQPVKPVALVAATVV
jgi:hypothetical protein